MKSFLEKYEEKNCVIPGSAKEFKKIQDDNYTLFRVCLLTINYDKGNKDEKWTALNEFSRFARDTLKVTVRDF